MVFVTLCYVNTKNQLIRFYYGFSFLLFGEGRGRENPRKERERGKPGPFYSYCNIYITFNIFYTEACAPNKIIFYIYILQQISLNAQIEISKPVG